MKVVVLFALSCVVSFLGCTLGLPVDSFVSSTLYNAMCIVFSVGMGLIVTFSLAGIRNINYVRYIRENIKQVRDKFITLFALCTILLILEKYCPNEHVLSVDVRKFVHITAIVFFTLSIGYFIYNFTKIQKLKNDIFDRLLKENAER